MNTEFTTFTQTVASCSQSCSCIDTAYYGTCQVMTDRHHARLAIPVSQSQRLDCWSCKEVGVILYILCRCNQFLSCVLCCKLNNHWCASLDDRLLIEHKNEFQYTWIICRHVNHHISYRIALLCASNFCCLDIERKAECYITLLSLSELTAILKFLYRELSLGIDNRRSIGKGQVLDIELAIFCLSLQCSICICEILMKSATSLRQPM